MMNIFLALVSAATMVAGPTNTPTDNPRRSSLDQQVHAAATEFFEDKCHVGLSIALIEGNRRHFYNYGSVSKQRPQLPGRRSLYEIGSITKTFTGTLAAQAVVEGAIDLDADFRNYLPASYPNLEFAGKPITLRTLAVHKSGLPRDWPDTDALFARPDFDKLPFQLIELEKEYDRARYLRELREVRLTFEPGQKLLYSNLGMKLLGFGLEHVHGRSFEELLSSQILQPLGMRDTSLVPTTAHRRRLVQGYMPSGLPAPHILPNAGAAAGLVASSEDLIKYAAWHLDERTPSVALSHQPLAGSLDDFALGMIWDMQNTAEGRKLWHSGGVFGMSSQLILFPDSAKAYVLLANDACFDTQGKLDKIAMTLQRGASKPPVEVER